MLNFGNAKQGYLPDKSPTTDRAGFEPNVYYFPPSPVRDDDVALSASVLTGSELWVDPLMDSAFFVSGGLAQALNKAKMKREFNFKHCLIIDQMKA